MIARHATLLTALLLAAACSTRAEPVSLAEACDNLRHRCHDLLPEPACTDTSDAGIDHARRLCLANAGSCDEAIVCEGGIARLLMDAGPTDASAPSGRSSDAAVTVGDAGPLK